MKRIVYTEEQRKRLSELYLSGLSVIKVAEAISLDKGVCRRELQTMGLLRTKREAQRIGGGIKYVRSDAFDTMTPDALYWIGFLYADGHIEKKAQAIKLTLSERDKEHLEKLNQFLGGFLNINDVTPKVVKDTLLKGQKTFGGKMFRIGVTDEKLYNALRRLGFTSTKTVGIIPHELLKHSKDFWRGVIDGDGWLTVSRTKGDREGVDSKMYRYPRIGLCGTKGTIEGFLEFIKENSITCKSAVKKAKREYELYSMDSSGKAAMSIMKLLYEGAEEYLDRKYQKYLDFMNNIY